MANLIEIECNFEARIRDSRTLEIGPTDISKKQTQKATEKEKSKEKQKEKEKGKEKRRRLADP